jgi:hypothetical protein
MPLTLRPTGLSFPAYRDWLDYVIVEDGRDVGRLYEDRNSLPVLRWFRSIRVREPHAGHHHERPGAKPRRGQSPIPGQLAEVPHRLDSARALLYLSRPCRVCVRVPCRRGLLRRAYQRPRGSYPLGRNG